MCQKRCAGFFWVFFRKWSMHFSSISDEMFLMNSLGKCLLDDCMVFLCRYINFFFFGLTCYCFNDITEIILKVALSTINQPTNHISTGMKPFYYMYILLFCRWTVPVWSLLLKGRDYVKQVIARQGYSSLKQQCRQGQMI